MAAVKRLKRELEDFVQEQDSLCTAGPVGDDLFHWEARLTGPPDSPYDGGCFRLDIAFPANYPASPPCAGVSNPSARPLTPVNPASAPPLSPPPCALPFARAARFDSSRASSTRTWTCAGRSASTSCTPACGSRTARCASAAATPICACPPLFPRGVSAPHPPRAASVRARPPLSVAPGRCGCCCCRCCRCWQSRAPPTP